MKIEIEKIEIIERPNEERQFEEDIKNSEEGELVKKDNFKRWAVYKEIKRKAETGKPYKIIKICFYPSAFK